VAKGVYTAGPRSGQGCVVKWFKKSANLENDYFALDIKAVDKAREIVNRFNESKIVNKTIKINIPEVWTFTEDTDNEFVGQKYLCEPYIDNYEKFNSNSGWNDDSTKWGKVMQALSHFSYYLSIGTLVLCDLQGGIYRHEAVLTDPVLLSRSGKYGVTDFGLEGMRSFFKEHRCNEFCSRSWPLPSHPTQRFRPTVPTRHSRAARTGFVVDRR
jgi:Alpha-kinase family